MSGSFSLPLLYSYIDTHILILDINILNCISHWLYGIREPAFLEIAQAQQRHKEKVTQLIQHIGIPFSHDFIDGGQFVTYEYLINIYRQRNPTTSLAGPELKKLLKSKCSIWNPRKVDYYLQRKAIVPWNVILESLACRLSKLDATKLDEISEQETIDHILSQDGLTLCNCHTKEEGVEILVNMRNYIKRLGK